MLALTLFTLCASAAITMPAEIKNHKNKTFSATDHMSERIVNGVEATNRQEFPYVVYVDSLFSDYAKGLCSGALISNKWILTAAHCFDHGPLLGVTVYLDILDYKYRKSGYKVSRTEIHPSYNEPGRSGVGSARNDIALLRISQNVPLSHVTNTIRLGADVLPGRRVTAVGYGRTSIRDMASAGKLRYVGLETISNNECAQSYGKELLYEGFLCTSGKTYKGTCTGDSGGPLVYSHGGIPVVVGVVSFGDTNCDPRKPAVYTRVSAYIRWIEQTMNENYKTNNFG